MRALWNDEGRAAEVGVGDVERIRCQCGSQSFRLVFTGNYELTAECAKCETTGVIYDG